VKLELKPPVPPVEARSVEEIPTGEDWHYEPKWDGFRRIAFRDQAEIYLQSKASQPLVVFVIPSGVEAVTQPAQRARPGFQSPCPS
jgi:hypothetical protein